MTKIHIRCDDCRQIIFVADHVRLEESELLRLAEEGGWMRIGGNESGHSADRDLCPTCRRKPEVRVVLDVRKERERERLARKKKAKPPPPPPPVQLDPDQEMADCVRRAKEKRARRGK